MAEYLTLSGLKVDASRVAAPAGDVAKTLLGEASAKPGALLVMGAYGHWRWREWVFDDPAGADGALALALAPGQNAVQKASAEGDADSGKWIALNGASEVV